MERDLPCIAQPTTPLLHGGLFPFYIQTQTHTDPWGLTPCPHPATMGPSAWLPCQQSQQCPPAFSYLPSLCFNGVYPFAAERPPADTDPATDSCCRKLLPIFVSQFPCIEAGTSSTFGKKAEATPTASPLPAGSFGSSTQAQKTGLGRISHRSWAHETQMPSAAPPLLHPVSSLQFC